MSVNDLRRGNTSKADKGDMQDELARKLERRRMKDSVSVRE